MKISLLILFLSISLNAPATERLNGFSDSMGKSSNPFSKLFGEDLKNEDVDSADNRQREEITEETKREAQRDAAQIKEGERHHDIKDDAASFAPDQAKKSAEILPEVDLISNINAEFEDIFNKLAAEEKLTIKSSHNKPTPLLIGDGDSPQATNKSNDLHAANEIITIPTASQDCVKEKVYTLDVDNAEQYERLEDFPFSYECVIER